MSNIIMFSLKMKPSISTQVTYCVYVIIAMAKATSKCNGKCHNTLLLFTLFTHNTRQDGYCVIINNMEFDWLFDNLDGYEDEKELQMLFTTLEFTVFVHQNVTANVMRSIVEEYSRMDCIGAAFFLIFFLNFLIQAYYIKHSQINTIITGYSCCFSLLKST